MDASSRQPWARAVILLAVMYLVLGVGFAALAGSAASHQVRVMWRLAAWVASATVYTAHIGYERFRLRNSPRSTALHVSMAVAAGAFALAVAATVRSLLTASGNRPLLLLALAVWPVVTALPAFLVALAACAVLARLSRSA